MVDPPASGHFRIFALQHDETSRINLRRMLKDDLVKKCPKKINKK